MGKPESAPPARLESLDAYRGLVMFLMMAEVLRLAAVSKALPGNEVWKFLAWHQTHVEWAGCTLHDLIQPSFSFMVGVSLPFSIVARLTRGQSRAWLSLHAFWRAAMLIALGIFLRSRDRSVPNYECIDTLCQIGLGYGFLFLLGFSRTIYQWLAFSLIVIGYWALYAFWPLPGEGFNWAAVGVKPEWFQQYGFTDFAAHWNKNIHPGHAFELWWQNRLPREESLKFSSGGYVVMNAIPTLATMILGLIAGGVLKRDDRTPWAKVLWLTAAGVIALSLGYALGYFGICPVVKRIWTPSWVLFSGGWCFLIMAGFYAVIDVIGFRKWAFPLAVIGMNSIAAYCMASLVKPIVHKAFDTFFGERAAQASGFEHGLFRQLGPEYEPFLHGAATLTVLWLILLWMYKMRIFIRI